MEFVLDPNGDAEFVLKQPDTMRLVIETEPNTRKRSVEPTDEPERKRARTRSGTKAIEAIEASDGASTASAPADVRVKVSSKHLTLASPVFRAMLNGTWMESQSAPSGGSPLRQVPGSEWDTEALMIVLRILHGQHREIPKHISLKLLTKIATIIDYYQCHEIVEIWVDKWIENLQRDNITFPRNVYGDNVILWLCVAWVFGRAKIFNVMAEAVLRHSKAPVQAPDLPISGVLDAIEKKRQALISKAFVYVARIQRALCQGNTACTVPDCANMLLGTLTKTMYPIEHLRDEETRPAEGYSVHSVLDTIRSYKMPNWASIRYDHLGKPIPTVHRCGLEHFLQRPLKKIDVELETPSFEAFQKALGPLDTGNSSRSSQPTARKLWPGQGLVQIG